MFISIIIITRSILVYLCRINKFFLVFTVKGGFGEGEVLNLPVFLGGLYKRFEQ